MLDWNNTNPIVNKQLRVSGCLAGPRHRHWALTLEHQNSYSRNCLGSIQHWCNHYKNHNLLAWNTALLWSIACFSHCGEGPGPGPGAWTDGAKWPMGPIGPMGPIEPIGPWSPLGKFVPMGLYDPFFATSRLHEPGSWIRDAKGVFSSLKYESVVGLQVIRPTSIA